MAMAFLLPLLIAAAQAPSVIVAIPMPAIPRSGVALHVPFEIAFVNASNKTQTLLWENCSWGFQMIRFEIKDDTGKVYSVTRKPQPWYKNVPSPMPLAPGDVAMRTIHLTDGTWLGLPWAQGQVKGPWHIRVLLEVKPDSAITPDKFWTGTAESRWHAATPLSHNGG